MLDTFRRAKGSGRPEKLYRITRGSIRSLMITVPHIALSLLAAAQRVYGETAAAKLLYTWFQAKTDTYTRKLAGADTLLTKAKMLSPSCAAPKAASAPHRAGRGNRRSQPRRASSAAARARRRA
jgi:predicted ArsR family transcriptional regulator